ncbi:MAG: hypothetical protein ACM3SW_19915 [Actinomycetota bacterium]
MKNDLERLQFLTRNFNFLQGYPIALAGLLYLVAGASELIWRERAAALIFGWLFLPGIALLVAACFFAQRFYMRKFGVVKTAPLDARRALGATGLVVLYVVLIVLGGPDFKNLGVPLDPSLLGGGLLLFLAGLLPGFPWRHYAGFGLLLAAVAFLPAFHVVPVQWFWHGWGFIFPGIAFLLCGMIDRLIFRRNLPSLPVEESHA